MSHRPTLFDFNGVLVDDEELHWAAFQEVLVGMDITLSKEDYFTKYVGLDDAGVFRAVLNTAGRTISAGIVRQLIGEKKPRYLARIATDLRVFPGAVDLVIRRAQHSPVGIVSGALEEEIRLCLDRLGLTQHVGFVVAAEHTKKGKPDPEGYRLGRAELARRGAADADAVVVEDTVEGVRAAKGANLRCIAVCHTCTLEALKDAGADVVARTLAELDDATLDGTGP